MSIAKQCALVTRALLQYDASRYLAALLGLAILSTMRPEEALLPVFPGAANHFILTAVLGLCAALAYETLYGNPTPKTVLRRGTALFGKTFLLLLVLGHLAMMLFFLALIIPYFGGLLRLAGPMLLPLMQLHFMAAAVNRDFSSAAVRSWERGLEVGLGMVLMPLVIVGLSWATATLTRPLADICWWLPAFLTSLVRGGAALPFLVWLIICDRENKVRSNDSPSLSPDGSPRTP